MAQTDSQSLFILTGTVALTISFRWQHLVVKALVRPFALFVREPIVQLLGIYMAFIYGTLYREYT